MRFIIKQKVFTLGDNFTIKDDRGVERFMVKGQLFSLGDKLRIYDMTGQELIYIEQKILRFLPEYKIYYLGRPMATIKKEFTFLKPRFNIQSERDNYTIVGNFLALNFSIFKNNRKIASISKSWISWGDTYTIDILEGENQAFILALVIIIDQVLHDDNHNNH